MDSEKKIKELEYRIFNLEKNLDLISKTLNRVEESLPFYYNESPEKENLLADNLLSIKDACSLLNITETKIMEWVKMDLIAFKRVGEITYFDKIELKVLFRKMMIQDLE